ncbi:hypothetical protein OIU77_020921 [Salix suchowensis]|uniref:Uncharacterized protein n=1 Tax=Salix suchowensis TaxID=1278906 RepID=A0ABQ9CBU5_9ROSI|nr:hypothetical protein OIU77_020921 [Salix suchowensis]
MLSKREYEDLIWLWGVPSYI